MNGFSQGVPPGIFVLDENAMRSLLAAAARGLGGGTSGGQPPSDIEATKQLNVDAGPEKELLQETTVEESDSNGVLDHQENERVQELERNLAKAILNIGKDVDRTDEKVTETGKVDLKPTASEQNQSSAKVSTTPVTNPNETQKPQKASNIRSDARGLSKPSTTAQASPPISNRSNIAKGPKKPQGEEDPNAPTIVTDPRITPPPGPYARPGDIFTHALRNVNRIKEDLEDAVEKVFGYGKEQNPGRLLLLVGDGTFAAGTSNIDRRRHLLVPSHLFEKIHNQIITELRTQTEIVDLDFPPFTLQSRHNQSTPTSLTAPTLYSDVTGVVVRSNEDFKAVTKAMDKHNKLLKRLEREKETAVQDAMSLEAARALMRNLEEECLFVSVDVEAYERNNAKLLEIGWTLYERPTLNSDTPNVLVARHFLVEENLHLKNQKYVPDHRYQFAFGVTEVKPMDQILKELEADLRSFSVSKYLAKDAQRSSSPAARKTVLVGHGIEGDIKWLREAGLSLVNEAVSGSPRPKQAPMIKGEATEARKTPKLNAEITLTNIDHTGTPKLASTVETLGKPAIKEAASTTAVVTSSESAPTTLYSSIVKSSVQAPPSTFASGKTTTATSTTTVTATQPTENNTKTSITTNNSTETPLSSQNLPHEASPPTHALVQLVYDTINLDRAHRNRAKKDAGCSLSNLCEAYGICKNERILKLRKWSEIKDGCRPQEEAENTYGWIEVGSKTAAEGLKGAIGGKSAAPVRRQQGTYVSFHNAGNDAYLTMYPPIPCGTSLQITNCSNPCSQPPGPCGHPPKHPCHSGPCPPCTAPVPVTCLGHHQTRDFPCHTQQLTSSSAPKTFSCGLPCGAKLQNCHHTCIETCHTHSKESEQETLYYDSDGNVKSCTQPCGKPIECCIRSGIGAHACRLSCGHSGSCSGVGASESLPSYAPSSESACEAPLKLTCTCGALQGLQVRCGEVESLGFVVKGNLGPGVSMRDQYKVDCESAVCEALQTALKGSLQSSTWWKLLSGCWTFRRLVVVRKLLSGGSVTLGKLESMHRSTLVSRQLLQARTSNFEGFDSFWFWDIPAELGRREIASFLNTHLSKMGYKIQNAFEFVGVVDFPREVSQDWKTRGRVFGSVVSSTKDHVVKLASPLAFNAAFLENVVRAGMGCVVVPVLVSKHGVGQMDMGGLREALEGEGDLVVENAEDVEVEVQAPLNVFEVLDERGPSTGTAAGGVEEEEEEDDEEIDSSILTANAESSAAAAAVAAEKKKKKKKKKKTKADEELEMKVEKDIQRIEDPLKKPAPTNQCAHTGCKEKLNSLSVLCKFCNRKFCMTHRLPEVHSPSTCGVAMKQSAQKTYQQDAKLAIGLAKKEGMSGGVPSLAKEREDAKRRLKEKIEKAARGSSGGGASSKRK
ncbi:hypothetical protein HDV05_006383 [Chytridiales sp. JEL 0842]|nr:hypothetical protein HDV05_006383 [Chytridiales sp. JEL 0842]